MKILYVVFEALLGGHVLSATTVAREMKSRGHSVMIAGKRGRMTPEIEESMPFFDVEIPVFHKRRQTYFTWSSFAAVWRLRKIIRNEKIEIVHAFDARSYVHGYLASLLEDVTILCTLCGGVDPYYNLPLARKIIVFSEEQKKRMTETWKWSSESIEVIRTRLDLQKIQDQSISIASENLLSYGVDPNRPLLMMITRFDALQIRGIYSLLDAIDQLRTRFVLQMVFIGGGDASDDGARRMAKSINEKYGEQTVVIINAIKDAFRFLRHATIVLGVGRSAFEGMAHAKPTIIIGHEGYAGTVSAVEVDELAYYNFSGRNRKMSAGPDLLAEKISQLLADEKMRKEVGSFAMEYVMRELDVRKGALRIEETYHQVRKKEIGKFARWFSFIKCILPVIIDNGLHRPKSFIKSLVNRQPKVVPINR